MYYTNLIYTTGWHLSLKKEVAYTRFWWGKPKERDHLGDPGLDGRIILRWIYRKWDVSVWTESSWHMIGAGGGHL